MAWSTSGRAKRLPPNWPVLRAMVLRRDNGICHGCGKHGADQVDHLVAGDNHAPDSLAAIHSDPCHRQKSSAEGGKAAAKSRATRPRKRPVEPHPVACRRVVHVFGHPNVIPGHALHPRSPCHPRIT
ncbi:HNH endonuclease [Streptomyces sp. NPDC058286]|uniref:HNH endonuclease n=1 Tax=Streptomyces sp. NPDC058286 TaxID=3346422 RepID=UPI0036E288F4